MATVQAPDSVYWIELAHEVAQLPHGQRTGRMQSAAQLKGITLQTAWDKLRDIGGFVSERKRRADSAAVNDENLALTEDQAKLVSGMVMKSRSAKGKNGMPMKRVLDILRHSVEVDFPEISESTAWRCLRHHCLHPEQLLAPRASGEIRTEGPNHLFEIDVSICRVYYLPEGGVTVIDEKKYNRNKPEHLNKIRHDRALRYVGIDHASGAFKVLYIRGSGETQENMFEFLCFLFAKHEGVPFHGVPKIIYWDMGAHQRASTIKNLLRNLGVRNLAHEAENAQATGAVEQQHRIIESHFESGLRWMPVSDVNALNAWAQEWTQMYCSSIKYLHTRHGMTRYGAWQKIQSVRLCPSREVLQGAMNTLSEKCKIHADFNGSIQFAIPSFGAQVYGDVISQIPSVCVGDWVDVSVNLYSVPEIQVMVEEEGKEVFYALKPRETEDFGYSVNVPVFDSGEIKGAKFSKADKQRQALDMLATGQDTPENAKKALKKTKQPLALIRWRM